MLIRQIAGLLCGILLLAMASTPGRAMAADPVVAFVDVNVAPMDSERVLLRQTVVIRDGLISAIGPHLPVPPGATVIDGHGRAWLSPGLADMHTHAESPEDMKLYLAYGITTVLHMGGASAEFIDQRRPRLNAGDRPGPYVYAAFRVDGSPRYGQFVVTTPDEARSIVRLARTNGYDFIKVYNDLSPECFQAIIDESKAQGLAVVGHGVTRVGLEKQLDAGQVLVAHAEEFLYTTFAPHDPAVDRQAAPDEALIPAAVAFVKRDHAFVTADLATYGAIARQWGRPEVVAAWLQSDEARTLSPTRRLAWRREDYVRRTGSLQRRQEFLAHFVRALDRAGVPIVAGTDAPSIPGMFPGLSVHEDLSALTAAGLSPYRALSAATRTAGEFIRTTVPGAQMFGVVAPGAKADLILSESNPLADLAVLRDPAGVMRQGRWFTRGELQAMREGVAADYASVAVTGPARTDRSSAAQ